MHAGYAPRNLRDAARTGEGATYGGCMAEDPRLEAARYRARKAAQDAGMPDEGEADATAARTPTARDRAAYVESAIQQAIRRGEFDNLPGAGKPLEGLSDRHDPDWWIRRKIQTEQLTGLGPPALRLRVEHAEFDEHIDGFTREQDVRDYIEDFNRRVIDARRQLLGGPPVVTPTRDVDRDVQAWHERRAARAAAAASGADARTATERRRRRAWLRRRAR
jgi:hypothetical protein